MTSTRRNSDIKENVTAISSKNPMSQVKGKEGKQIHEDETIAGKIREGRHTGEVEEIITSKEKADERGVKIPPKLLFTDQHDRPGFI
jgi:hypothetical protein